MPSQDTIRVGTGGRGDDPNASYVIFRVGDGPDEVPIRAMIDRMIDRANSDAPTERSAARAVLHRWSNRAGRIECQERSDARATVAAHLRADGEPQDEYQTRVGNVVLSLMRTFCDDPTKVRPRGAREVAPPKITFEKSKKTFTLDEVLARANAAGIKIEFEDAN